MSPAPASFRSPTGASSQSVPVVPFGRQHLIPMLVSGFVFQALASGHAGFALAAWLSLVSLAVLARAAPWPVFLGGAFGVVFLGRLVGWLGLLTDADGQTMGGLAHAAAVLPAALLIVGTLLVHRLVFTWLPLLGALALPCAVVVAEGLAQRYGLPASSLLPLWTSQPGNTPLWRFVDVLSPAGVSFAVAYAQSTLAGYAEVHLAPDPWPQATRERGLLWHGVVAFFGVGAALHLGGLWRADLAARGAEPGAHGGTVGGTVQDVCAAVLVVLMVLAGLVAARKRTPRADAAAAAAAEAAEAAAGTVAAAADDTASASPSST